MKALLKYTLRACVGAAVLCAPPAHACLNDRDTLADEAQKHPDILQAVTGRFERNPPLYYEMRIARVAKDLQRRPDNLDEYDDIAVACDRLGRDGEAIAWMDRKKTRLPAYDPKNTTQSEEWYKYYANIGTCRMHRWIRAGGDRKKIADVRRAHDEVQRAVQIKPDAHFGREKYQLIVMEWVIDSLAPRKSGWEIKPLWRYIGDKVNPEKFPEAATAFAGLVTLGGAWESVDVFNTLAYVSSMGDRSAMHVGYLAMLRADELSRAGGRSLVQKADPAFPPIDDWPLDEQAFQKLRREAEQWNQGRVEYMSARLKGGRHPDTDPTFWKDYRPAPPPLVPDTTPPEEKRRKSMAARAAAIESVLFFAVLSAPIFIIWRKVRARHGRRAAGSTIVNQKRTSTPNSSSPTPSKT